MICAIIARLYRRCTTTGGSALISSRRTPVALVLAVVLAFSAVSAYASPASAKREQARQVKQQIDALDVEVELAAEEYNEARIAHESLVSEMRATATRIAETEAVITDLQTRLEARAEAMYRNGPFSFLEVLLGAQDFEQFSTMWDLLQDINSSDAGNVENLQAAHVELAEANARLAEQEAAAKTVLDQMAANKAAIERKLADRKRMLAGLETEIAAIEAAERARAAAAERAAVSRSFPLVRQRSFPPPTRAPRSEVVDIAKRYLGAPYRWAASGPDMFDCSGFTLFVFRQVGVSLPHSSRAQYGVGERVSRADLQPGDLVFFGSPIRHVGIYVGGGQYIHSPRTGDVVKISSLGGRRDYVGATRP
ncbi:MAG: C40 family peptidase [Clostridiales bacterium]|nr:C40 family peptidase [Clostridiales bacterium]